MFSIILHFAFDFNENQTEEFEILSCFPQCFYNKLVIELEKLLTLGSMVGLVVEPVTL